MSVYGDDKDLIYEGIATFPSEILFCTGYVGRQRPDLRRDCDWRLPLTVNLVGRTPSRRQRPDLRRDCDSRAQHEL